MAWPLTEKENLYGTYPYLKTVLKNLKMRNKTAPRRNDEFIWTIQIALRKPSTPPPYGRRRTTDEVSGDKQEYYHHDFLKWMMVYHFRVPVCKWAKHLRQVRYLQSAVQYHYSIQQWGKGAVVVGWIKHIDKKTLYGDSGPTATEVTGTHLNGIAYYKPDDAFIISFGITHQSWRSVIQQAKSYITFGTL